MLNINEEHIDKITEAFHLILKGKRPEQITLPDGHPDDEIKQAVEYLNQFINVHNAFTDSIAVMSKGELDFEAPKSRMLAAQSLKNLQANLRHLTWKTQQIADGDFDLRIDFMGDFSVAFNSMAQQLKQAFEKIEQQNAQLSEAYETIKQEKERSDRLLLNVLPTKVADDLKRTGKTTPHSFQDVTVLFSDFVEFTRLSATLDPETLIAELNDIFTAFDNIIESNGCERIKTIGDAYLAVSGMPAPDPQHVENILDSAFEMIAYLENRNKLSLIKWKARIGIHTGKVVGGVVGIKKYIYDVFGDTINIASRMENHSEPMKINVSEEVFELAKERYIFINRGGV